MSIFEALMLVCFGLSWPLSIARTLRSKSVAGKSPYFIGIVILGYLFGLINKIQNMDWVFWLYILNIMVVSADLILYFKYRNCGKTNQ
jgi:RsiW-degrading membrane proteinase PrsW (M82 family)